MAISLSSTLSNFLSFLSPTKPPSPPQQQLNLPPSPTPFPSQILKTKPSHNSVVLSQQQETHSSSSSSSRSSSSCDELSSVICPSLAYANTLFFKSAYNVEVFVGEHEAEEKLLNRFRREAMKVGVIQECKRRRRPLAKTFAKNRQDVPTTKREEDEDNWDLPEDDFPY